MIENALFQSKKDARLWVCRTVKDIGIGFHPDTPAQDYVRHDGVALLSPAEALAFERLRLAAFTLLGDEIYEIALRFARRMMGWR